MSEFEEEDFPVEPTDAQHPERDGDRQSLFMHGELTLSYMEQPQTVRIRNLSKGGVMVETALPVTNGEAFTLVLPNVGPVRGRVAWVGGGRFGAAFDAPIEPNDVRRKIVVKSPAYEGYVDLNRRPGRPGFAHLNRRR